MGKTTISMAIFSIAMLVYQRVYPINIPLNPYKIPLTHYKLNHYFSIETTIVLALPKTEPQRSPSQSTPACAWNWWGRAARARLPGRKKTGAFGKTQKKNATLVEGSLEVKLPTIWTDEKQSRVEAERRGKIRREKIRRERVRGQKIQMREKVGKSRNTVFFQWFVAPEGRKVGSLKRRVRTQLATGAMKNCTPLWRKAHFQVKMHQTPQVRTTFGSYDVAKVHAVVARSTFPSQNVQNTRGSDHFWKLRCWKSARRCGAKHISKSKCTKHQGFGPLLEVAMLKKCTPLWREAHFQVKMYKTPGVRTTFGSWDIEKVHAVVARSRFPSQKC